MILEDKTMPEKTVKVKAPYRVVHEGNPYSDGDEVAVPEETAQQWVRLGWIEKAK